MSISPYAIVSLEEAKAYFQERENIQVKALSIYNNNSDGATTASTVEVSSSSLILRVTSGGANNGTSTLAFSNADYDTIGELVTAINALDKGWVANLKGREDAESTTLLICGEVSCLNEAYEISLYGTNDFFIEMLIDNCSAWIDSRCQRNIISRTYTLEKYSGGDSDELILKNYPITDIAQLSIGKNGVFTIGNTLTDTTKCIVKVSSSGITLTINGGVNNGDTHTFAFTGESGYTSLSTLATAIGAYGKGWTASVASGYGDILSTQLIPQLGVNVKETSYNLYIPAYSETDFEVDEEAGIIIKHGGFGLGLTSVYNVFVTYTAGYTSDTIPKELKEACLELIAFAYSLARADRAFNSEGLGDYNYSIKDFETGIPPETLWKIEMYAKKEIPLY